MVLKIWFLMLKKPWIKHRVRNIQYQQAIKVIIFKFLKREDFDIIFYNL